MGSDRDDLHNDFERFNFGPRSHADLVAEKKLWSAVPWCVFPKEKTQDARWTGALAE